MQIVQTLNDFIKILYAPQYENVALADFLYIKDGLTRYLGQVVEISDDKFDENKNIAKVKLTHSINEKGVISDFNFMLPSKHAEILFANQREVLNFVNDKKQTIQFGQDVKYSRGFEFNTNFFNNSPIVFCDKIKEYNFVACELGKKLSSEKKVVIFDYTGSINLKGAEVIKAKTDFKLPLNYFTLDSIWEKGIEGASLETQVVCGDIFNEIRHYSKTVRDRFIPFSQFLKVVAKQYKATPIRELLVLRNRLIHYQQEEIFANTKADMKAIYTGFDSQITIIDFSELPRTWQADYSEFVLHNIRNNAYVFLRINETNFSNKLCELLHSKKRGFAPIPCVSNAFVKLPALSEFSYNSIITHGLNIKKDFGYFAPLVSSIKQNTFMLLGEDTKNFAFLVKNLNEDTPKDVQIEIKEEAKISFDGDVIKNKKIKQKIEHLKDRKIKEIEGAVDDFLYKKPTPIEIKAEDASIQKTLDKIDEKISINNEDEKKLTVQEEPEENLELANVENDKKFIADTYPENEYILEEVVSKEEIDLFNELDKNHSGKAEIVELDVNDDFLDAIDEANMLKNQIPASKLNSEKITEEEISNIEQVSFDDNDIEDNFEAVLNQEIEETVQIQLAEPVVFDKDEDEFNLLGEVEDYTKSQEEIIEPAKDEVAQEEISGEEIEYQEEIELDSEENEEENFDDIEDEIEPIVAQDEDKISSDFDAILNAEETSQEEPSETQEETTEEVEEELLVDDLDEFLLDDEVIEENTETQNIEEENEINYQEQPSQIQEAKTTEVFEDELNELEEELEAPIVEQEENSNIQSSEEVEEEVLSEEFDLSAPLDENTQKFANDFIENIPVIMPDSKEGQEIETFEEGESVTHEKYGNGTVLQIIEYSDKTLLQIDFEKVGKRLLDPKMANIKKAE
ncbi:hypothetical protein IJC60_00850 [bacterium]|nr:hypothetical protein [bacterium]